MKLLLASNNPGKLVELRRLLAGLGFEVLAPADLGLALEVVEDGATYEANAVKKARAFAEASGMMALADDSGLEVDALAGGPGVYSARYGGAGLDDRGRYELLLRELEGVPAGRRSARFRAVVAVAAPGGEVEVFEGTCEGRIGVGPRGIGGFGYDPVFETSDGRTAAELSDGEWDAISHRGEAMRRAVAWLRGLAVRG